MRKLLFLLKRNTATKRWKMNIYGTKIWFKKKISPHGLAVNMTTSYLTSQEENKYLIM